MGARLSGFILIFSYAMTSFLRYADSLTLKQNDGPFMVNLTLRRALTL